MKFGGRGGLWPRKARSTIAARSAEAGVLRGDAMNFKTKDLMVTVLPKANAELAKVCLLATHICRAPTWNCGNCSLLTLCAGCTRNITRCWNCSLLISCFGCSVAISNGCNFGNSCGPGGSACDPTIFCFGSREPWVIEHIEDLVAI